MKKRHAGGLSSMHGVFLSKKGKVKSGGCLDHDF